MKYKLLTRICWVQTNYFISYSLSHFLSLSLTFSQYLSISLTDTPAPISPSLYFSPSDHQAPTSPLRDSQPYRQLPTTASTSTALPHSLPPCTIITNLFTPLRTKQRLLITRARPCPLSPFRIGGFHGISPFRAWGWEQTLPSINQLD